MATALALIYFYSCPPRVLATFCISSAHCFIYRTVTWIANTSKKLDIMMKLIILLATTALAQVSLPVTNLGERNFTRAMLSARARWESRQGSSPVTDSLSDGGDCVIPGKVERKI